MSYADIPRRCIQGAILLLSLLAVALTLSLTQASGASAATTSASSPTVVQPGDPYVPLRVGLAAYATATDHAQQTAPRTYTVHSGNTLSGIAQRFYGRTKVWPCVFDANKGRVHNPNEIFVGQVLLVPVHLKTTGCHAPPAWVPPPVSTASTTASYHPVYNSNSGSYGSVNPANYSGFQACVIARESSGNSQVMNSSSHYGLYQFSESTWIAYGGSAADFGHASVAQQNQVFANAMAQGGESNWSPYDGC